MFYVNINNNKQYSVDIPWWHLQHIPLGFHKYMLALAEKKKVQISTNKYKSKKWMKTAFIRRIMERVR